MRLAACMHAQKALRIPLQWTHSHTLSAELTHPRISSTCLAKQKAPKGDRPILRLHWSGHKHCICIALLRGHQEPQREDSLSTRSASNAAHKVTPPPSPNQCCAPSRSLPDCISPAQHTCAKHKVRGA